MIRGFDPAEETDGLESGTHIRIRDVYEGLREAGHEDEAAELRELSPLTRQNRRAIQLKTEHLVTVNTREETERTYDRDLDSLHETRAENVKEFLKSRASKKADVGGFDPAADAPKNAQKVRVMQTYDALRADGYEDEATQLREASPIGKQDSLARELCQEHLGVKSPLLLGE